jgi:hypothetical protein
MSSLKLIRRASQLLSRIHFAEDRGAVSALVALAIIPIIAVTAVGVDGGRIFVEDQRIKTAS